MAVERPFRVVIGLKESTSNLLLKSDVVLVRLVGVLTALGTFLFASVGVLFVLANRFLLSGVAPTTLS